MVAMDTEFGRIYAQLVMLEFFLYFQLHLLQNSTDRTEMGVYKNISEF